nr:Chain A, GPM12 [synthetic construct]
GYDPATGTFG